MYKTLFLFALTEKLFRKLDIFVHLSQAGVVKLVDTLDLGSSA